MKIKIAHNFIKKTTKLAKSCVVFLFLSAILTQNSYAGIDYGAGRVRSCLTSGTNVEVEGLDFDMSTGGRDIEFVLSNPVCLTIIATTYVAVKTAISAMNTNCNSGSPFPRLVPNPIMDIYDITKAGVVGNRSPNCLASIATAASSFSTAIAEMAIIYEIAKDVFATTRVCGSDWRKASAATYNFSADSYKATVKSQVDQWLRDKATDKLDFSEQKYREWYYGGIEVEDNPDSGETCYDPTVSRSGPFPKQKYYLKGLEAGNFNCEKYHFNAGDSDPVKDESGEDIAITETRQSQFDAAYACCKKRSSEFICLETINTVENNLSNSVNNSLASDVLSTDRNRTFCKAGDLCTLEDITYTTYLRDNDRLVCAESYSLCPYNFSINGGTEYCDYWRDGIWNGDSETWDLIKIEEVERGDCINNSEIRNQDCTYNAKAGKCRNYCQMLTHCTTTSQVRPYVSGISSPYFSEACLNFSGDSQNKASFKGGILLGNQKHFSAPIAQCVKETLENVFYNRAGHSQCLNYNENPSSDGTCASGLYVSEGDFIFKKGLKVKEKSFFEMVQNNLQTFVKLVITFSIMLFGMSILVGKADVRKKKELLIYILKIALVLYFATGDAWQRMFFDGVYGASSELSRMVFKIRTPESDAKRDGCQFGRIYLPDGSEEISDAVYPDGKEYLSMWDTLDCKLMRYLGFGPEASAANIAMLILAAFFTGPIGIYFALSVLIFGILLLSAILRALHIFLSSALSIIIMVFVSPVIIPLVLFEKTKSIFDNWFRELISFAVQPMILFAYMAILIMGIDETLVGSASFQGNPPFKTMDCSEKCIDTFNNDALIPYVGDQAPACDENGQKIIDPYEDSVACLISIDSFGKFPGLEVIGLAIPIITHFFEGDIKAKILTMLKGALLMFLLYKFMDEIPGIATALTGGTGLPGDKSNAQKMFEGMQKMSRNIQKRFARGAAKGTKNVTKSARRGMSELMSKNRRKEDPDGGGGGSGRDSTSSSENGSGADSSGSSMGGSGTDSSASPKTSGGDSSALAPKPPGSDSTS